MIGEIVGKLHPESINKRCVMAIRFLKFRVDIIVMEPIPAGVFQNIKELWIQFKYESTTCNGISAKLCGPWQRSEHTGSTLFLNALERERSLTGEWE